MENKYILYGKDELQGGKIDACYFYGSEELGIHSHEYFETEFILSGEAVHNINGQEFKTMKGSAYFLSPSDFHKYELRLTKEKFSFYTIKFDMMFIDEKIVFEMINTKSQTIVAKNGTYDLLYSLFKQIYENINANKPLNEIYLKNLLESILITIIREQGDSPVKFTVTQNGVQKVLNYIHNYFKDDISLDDISKYVSLSKNYMCVMFKNNMSKTIFQYIRDLRLGYSLNLLESFDLSVTEVCYQSGYRSLSQFLRDFKKAYGTSPLKYKRELNH